MSDEQKEVSEEVEIVKEEDLTPTKKEEINLQLDTVSANSSDLIHYAGMLIESKILPKSYNTPQKVLVVIQRGKELGYRKV